MEIKTSREIKAIYSLGGIDSKKWVSVDSLLKLSPKELIEEVRKLHIQIKELEKEE